MFGFLGHPVCKVEFESSGAIIASNRYFNFSHRVLRPPQPVRFILSGGDDPDAQKTDLSATQTPYDGIVNRIRNHEVQYETFRAGTGFGLTATSLFLTNVRQFTLNNTIAYRYDGNDALTRSVVHEMPYYFISSIITSASNSPNTPTSTSNEGINEIVINGAQFPNLESIGFFKTFHSELTLLFNNPKFKYFNIALNPNLTTINGILPPSTESAYIGDVPITSVDELLSEAVNIKGLAFASYSGNIEVNIVNANTTLVGDLDISHIVGLREFVIHNQSSLDEIILPSKSDWTWFHLSSCPGIIISNTTLNEILASPNLMVF